jgi:hypothetical protein
MNEEGAAHIFAARIRIAKRGTSLSPRDQAPGRKPRCDYCQTPFMAKYKGSYIHYQLLRRD